MQHYGEQAVRVVHSKLIIIINYALETCVGWGGEGVPGL